MKTTKPTISKEAVDQLTDLVVQLKEKQGTERQEVQAMIKEMLADQQRQLLDRLLGQAGQYNEYDPETQSDDPVEAVPVRVIKDIREELGERK